ncbi:globin domain-containing protein [Rivularia sp. PCC 7116]|uniref:globin domain-containing protein n=1 Tax=Rivularia sp. PCC 7116 TaxID=373994 RepID=UPI00352765AE
MGKVHSNAGVPSCAYPAISDTMFGLFERHVPDFDADLRQAWQTLFDKSTAVFGSYRSGAGMGSCRF